MRVNYPRPATRQEVAWAGLRWLLMCVSAVIASIVIVYLYDWIADFWR